MCLYPRLIENKKYTSTKKNDGKIPEMRDRRVKYVPIGCGYCMECRKQKAREWQVRLTEDIKSNINGKMVTLTLSDEQMAEIVKKLDAKLTGYNLDNAIAGYAVRHFVERWRKQYGKSIRHWLVTELGHEGTENIHLHGIIWTNESTETVNKIWGYGFTWPTPKHGWKNTWVNNQTVNYVIKYIHKQDEKHKTYKSKVFTSAGIGGKYTNTYNAKRNRFQGKETDETYKSANGYKISMPIYWRNKIYNEEERERLWLQRLDKQERWIMGEKIDISTPQGEQQYLRLLKWYQEKNTQFGYIKPDDEKIWELKAYEEQQRRMNQDKRIARAASKEQRKSACSAMRSKERATQHV